MKIILKENIDNLSRMAKVMNCSLFVKNGSNYCFTACIITGIRSQVWGLGDFTLSAFDSTITNKDNI